MRGSDNRSGRMLGCSARGALVPPDRSRHRVRTAVEKALADLHSGIGAISPRAGRPAIPPETLHEALLLQAFYSTGSIRLFTEWIQPDILFRRFTRLSPNSKGRKRQNGPRASATDPYARFCRKNDRTVSRATYK